MFTNRTKPVTCPACGGERGDVQSAGWGQAWEDSPRDEWVDCQTCNGLGWVERLEALAWAIGEERRRESALPPQRLPADWAAAGLVVVV